MTIRPMRCAASVGLFALGLPALLGGCNQVFGISQTVAYDAPVDVIARHDYARLLWQVAAVTEDGKPGAPQLLPISPMPAIRLAKLGAPGEPLGVLMPPSDEQQTSTYATDGAVNVPADFFGAPWRMEYTLADGVPHEVQWNAPDGAGLVTVPVFGRLMRDALPAGSGYMVTPTGTPGDGQQTPPPPPVANTRLFTTGLWAESKVQSPTAANVDALAMVSLSGAFGKMDATKGDRALMLAFGSVNTCTSAFAAAEVTDATLHGGSYTTDTPPWLNTLGPPRAPAAGMPESNRLGVIGDLGDGNVNGSTSIMTYGLAPSDLMPGLAATGAPADAVRLMPMPVMLATATCPYSQPIPDTVGTSVLPDFPRVLHLQLVNSRAFMGATLASGMESTMLAASGGFALALPAPFATKIRLTPQGATDQTSLDGDAPELVPFPVSDKPLLLTFQPQTDPQLRADVYEVRLHTITAGGALTTERIYTIPASANPSVKIDGGLLVKDKTYVFEIRTIKGHPKASTFDFSAVDYPYGQTIVFPRSFVVQ